MRRYALIALAIVVALIALVAAIGAALPKRHVAVVAATYRSPPERVWALVSDLGAWPSWQPEIRRMERAGEREGRAVWVMEDGNGEMRSEVLEATAPTATATAGPSRAGRLRTRIADPDLPFGGTWTWDVAPAGGGTEVTITEDGEIYNPVFRFLARFAFGYTGSAEAFLGALGAKLGEPVSPRILRAENISD